MEIIDINSSNFESFKNLDIIAFSFANIGALGEKGGIKIVTSNRTLYHTNMVKSIKVQELFLICPILKDCSFYLFNAIVPKGWTPFYMGGGNFLVVKDEYEEIITKAIPDGLYNNWINVICKAIHSQKNKSILKCLKKFLLSWLK